jgi:hypothetical protein
MSLLEKASLVITPNAVKAGKLYSVIPNTTLGDMDVVRATTKTRTNSLGVIENVAVNVAALDYTNGSCPSLLVEPQRTNLLIFSNDFIANWSNDGTTTRTANAGISPDGTQNATKIVGTGGYGYRFTPILSVGTYNYSIYVRSPAPSNINITINDIGGSGGTTTSIAVTTNWQRFNITKNVTLGTSVIIAYEELDLGIDYYVYNCQLEAGSYATSLIPTVASTVTRNADVISKTGISSLIGQTEGTMFSEFKLETANVNQSVYAALTDGSFTNAIVFGKEGGLTPNKIAFYIIANGVFIFNNYLTTVTSNYVKCAISYKSGNYFAYVNGILIASGTSSFTFSTALNSFGFSSNGALSSLLEKIEIKSSQIYKTALSNAELAQLTTI